MCSSPRKPFGRCHRCWERIRSCPIVKYLWRLSLLTSAATGLGAWAVACSSAPKSEPRAGLSSDYWRPPRCSEAPDAGLFEVTASFTPDAPRSTDCGDAGDRCCYEVYFSTCAEDPPSDAGSVRFEQVLSERACAATTCFPLCEDRAVITIPTALDGGMIVPTEINWHAYEGLRKFHDREPATFDPSDTMAVYVTNVDASVETSREGAQPCRILAVGPSSALVIPLRADGAQSRRKIELFNDGGLASAVDRCGAPGDDQGGQSRDARTPRASAQ